MKRATKPKVVWILMWHFQDYVWQREPRAVYPTKRKAMAALKEAVGKTGKCWGAHWEIEECDFFGVKK